MWKARMSAVGLFVSCSVQAGRCVAIAINASDFQWRVNGGVEISRLKSGNREGAMMETCGQRDTKHVHIFMYIYIYIYTYIYICRCRLWPCGAVQSPRRPKQCLWLNLRTILAQLVLF